jgi:hypothetical protein
MAPGANKTTPSIPERLGLVRSTPLQTNIHGMLMGVPSISPEGLVFILISSILSFPPAKIQRCWSSSYGN